MPNGCLKLDMSKIEILIFPINLFFFLTDIPIYVSNTTTHPVAQAENLGLILYSSILIGVQPFSKSFEIYPHYMEIYQPSAPPWCKPSSFLSI